MFKRATAIITTYLSGSVSLQPSLDFKIASSELHYVSILFTRTLMINILISLSQEGVLIKQGMDTQT
jgi:hypothetical protein